MSWTFFIIIKLSSIITLLIVTLQLSKAKLKLWSWEIECSTHFAVHCKQGGQRKQERLYFRKYFTKMTRGNSSSPLVTDQMQKSFLLQSLDPCLLVFIFIFIMTKITLLSCFYFKEKYIMHISVTTLTTIFKMCVREQRPGVENVSSKWQLWVCEREEINQGVLQPWL